MDYRASVRRAEERQPELPLSPSLQSPSSATAVTVSSQHCLIKREREGGGREGEGNETERHVRAVGMLT